MNLLEKNFWKKNLIYVSSIIFAIAIFVWGVFFEEEFQKRVNTTYEFIINNLSWVYCGLIVVFFAYCIWIGFSKFRNIRLGDDDSRPEFSNLSWFSMLFSAGIGVGLVFWGVAEPLTHYFKPLEMKSMSDGALEFAFTKSFLHMGLSAWACYAVLALGLAYMHFRRKKPMLISSLLSPLIGEEKSHGALGKIIDMMTVLATMAGIITSLGMGTLQVSSGLNYMFGIKETNSVKIIIVLIITVLFLLSACSGVGKGIKIISNTNILLAMFLFVGSMIVGPFGDMVSNFLLGLKGYAVELATTNNNIFISGEWYGKWTIFYWGWWLAWAPSVAIFIARISKGRTIKEFIFGVLFVPAGFCLAWMAVFGTLGINVADKIGIEGISKVETTLFLVFNQYPMGKVLSIVAIILIFTFFITSADSATYVLGMIVSNGEIKVKNSKKIVLGVIQSILTLVLLFAGGLDIIQNFSIIMALPFGIIMFIGVIAFTKALYKNEDVKNESLIYKVKLKFNNLKNKEVNYPM